MLTFEKSVTRKSLLSIPVPSRKGIVSDRWKGIQHGLLADTLVERVQEAGFKILGERWKPYAGGAGLHGSLDLQPTAKVKIDVPKGLILSFGVQHSNDGRTALRFMAGARVLVCANGMITDVYQPGEDRRKHTSGVELADVLDDGIAKFGDGVRNAVASEIRSMTGMDCKNPRIADHLFVEAGRKELIPWSSMGKVVKEWQAPRHADFKPRNAWSMYNCFTEIGKELAPNRQVKLLQGFRVLLSQEAKAGLFRNN